MWAKLDEMEDKDLQISYFFLQIVVWELVVKSTEWQSLHKIWCTGNAIDKSWKTDNDASIHLRPRSLTRLVPAERRSEHA